MSAGTVSFVTGTDTDVGKTVATAALAVALATSGKTVAVYKPTQTGVSSSGHGDMAEVSRLSGNPAVHEGIRLSNPMAPAAAALREGRRLPDLKTHVATIMGLAQTYEHVLVEGAGGLLVDVDGRGNTIAELAVATRTYADVDLVVVCRSGLGTLNHTLLTLEALHHRGLQPPQLLIGSWPVAPSYLELSNRESLQATTAHFLGFLPAHAAQLEPAIFRRLAPAWLGMEVV